MFLQRNMMGRQRSERAKILSIAKQERAKILSIAKQANKMAISACRVC